MNPASPLVSVIVPCYNYGKFLNAALDSVLAQTHKNWECIIIDDGSTDDTAEIANAYAGQDNRFQYIRQQNQGVSAARNTGINRSSGNYIQFLDADDKLSSTKLELQIKQFAHHPEVDIIYGDAFFFNSENPMNLYSSRHENKRSLNHFKRSGSGKTILHQLCINNFIEVGAPLSKRTLIQRTGGFDASYKSYEDWQFWFRCVLNGARLLYIPGEGTEYFIRQGHASLMTNSKGLMTAGIRIRRFMFPFLGFQWKLYNTYRLSKLLMKTVINPS